MKARILIISLIVTAISASELTAAEQSTPGARPPQMGMGMGMGMGGGGLGGAPTGMPHSRPVATTELKYRFANPIAPRHIAPSKPMPGMGMGMGMMGTSMGMGMGMGMGGMGPGMGMAPGAYGGTVPRRVQYDKRENKFFLTAIITGGPGLTQAYKSKPGDTLTASTIPVLTLPADLRESIVFIETAGPSSGEVDAYNYRVGLAAPTIEEALNRTQRLLDAANEWWAKNRSRYLEYDIAQYTKQIDDLRQEKEPIDRATKPYRDILGGLKGLSQDTIRDFQGKLVTLNVQITGTEARIKAAEEFFHRVSGRANSDQATAIETMRIAAHIDLAGLLAQRDQIGKVLDAEQQLRHMADKSKDLENKIVLRENILTKLKNTPTEFAPFHLQHEAVIRPIDWSSKK